MSPKKRLSRQDLLRAQQRATFVGRVEQLEAFQHNLTHLLRADDGFAYPGSFLFNIWGQGGVGKSTLLRQFSVNGALPGSPGRLHPSH
jgi:ABC-type cobalamin/Fe3+-siderophores transport system ATPase subunit